LNRSGAAVTVAVTCCEKGAAQPVLVMPGR
jgi:hypothetical protein